MKTLRKISLLFLAVVYAGTVSAADRCVSNNTELVDALLAATDGFDDDIRLQTGNYSLPSTTRSIRGAFRLTGGWNSGCTLQLPLSSFSEIAGSGTSPDLRIISETA